MIGIRITHRIKHLYLFKHLPLVKLFSLSFFKGQVEVFIHSVHQFVKSVILQEASFIAIIDKQ